MQHAVTGYTQIQPQIAAMAQLLGSGQTSALLDSIERDKLLPFVGGDSASLLGQPHVQLVGSPYGIEMVNGGPFLGTAAHLKPRDRVGMVYQAGDYGGNALTGARYAAKRPGSKSSNRPSSAPTPT